MTEETNTETHTKYITEIGKSLRKENLKDFKHLCKAYLQEDDLEEVPDFRELVDNLELRGYEVSWKCGGYSKLVYLFETARLPLIIDIIKKCEREVNVQKVSVSVHSPSNEERKNEIHLRLVLQIKNTLSKKDFKDIKYLCKAYLKEGDLEEVADFCELVDKLELRGNAVSWRSGYTKLVSVFKTGNLPIIRDLIVKCEMEVNAVLEDVKPTISPNLTPKKKSLKRKNDDT